MKPFILWTGLMSGLAGLSLQFPTAAATLIPAAQPGMMLHVFGLMAMFLGVMLALCSRDLRHRAPLVMWEGLLRLGGFILMAGYGLWGGDRLMIGAGIFDLFVGAVYIVGLPRHLGVSAIDLILDRPISSRL